MALAKQQHVQSLDSLFGYEKMPSWLRLPAKATRSSCSPEPDTEQPGTPMRMSSASKGSGVLKPQYSEDDEPMYDPVAVVQPFQRAATGSLVSQEQQQKQQAEQWNAARQAATVVFSCVAWIIISSATILINKHIMVDLS